MKVTLRYNNSKIEEIHAIQLSDTIVIVSCPIPSFLILKQKSQILTLKLQNRSSQQFEKKPKNFRSRTFQTVESLREQRREDPKKIMVLNVVSSNQS